MSDSYLRTIRRTVFEGEDKDLYLHVGHFLTWYAHVEWHLTMIIAVVMSEADFPAFHTLTMGMDARTKIRRLKRLCGIKKRRIGTNFALRLKRFGKECDFRDRISHTAIIPGDDHELFHFASLDRMPWKAMGAEMPDKPDAESFSRLEFFERGLWLSFFKDDLLVVLNHAIAKETLEIENPRSPLPKESPSSSDPPDD